VTYLLVLSVLAVAPAAPSVPDEDPTTTRAKALGKGESRKNDPLKLFQLPGMLRKHRHYCHVGKGTN